MRYHPHNRHFLVFVQHDHEEMSRRAAKYLHTKVRDKPDLLLCAATGGTPTRAYEVFAQSWQGHAPQASRLRSLPGFRTSTRCRGSPAKSASTCTRSISPTPASGCGCEP